MIENERLSSVLTRSVDVRGAFSIDNVGDLLAIAAELERVITDRTARPSMAVFSCPNDPRAGCFSDAGTIARGGFGCGGACVGCRVRDSARSLREALEEANA